MRLACIIRGGCDWKPICADEWLPKDHSHATVRLLRFEECPICRTTRATITSPEPEEARMVIPERTFRDKQVAI